MREEWKGRTETDNVKSKLVEPSLNLDNSLILRQRLTSVFDLSISLESPGLDDGLVDNVEPVLTELRKNRSRAKVRGYWWGVRGKKKPHLLAPLDDNRCESAKMRRTEAGEHHFALTLVRVACQPEEGQSSDRFNRRTSRCEGIEATTQKGKGETTHPQR
jgi:hypothetical protein